MSQTNASSRGKARRYHARLGPQLGPASGSSRVLAAVEQIRKRSDLLWLMAMLAVSLLFGLLTLRDFGQSWDEPDIYRYADYAIQSYRYILHPQGLALFRTDLNLYGPAYFMAADIAARFAAAIFPSWIKTETWHFIYLLTFLVGAAVLYLLARRWLRAGAALGATLMFLSQPLLWGHAFINPKDLPFMVLFMATVYLGLEMVDHYFVSRRSYGLIVCAAIVLGMTTSFRVVGPLAGLLVCIYAVARSPRKSFRLLGLYLPVAALASYLLWPYLWGHPVQGLLASLGKMSQFPFARKALFMGQYYPVNALPRDYFIVMAAIQLTLPLLLLALVGLGLSVWGWICRQGNGRGLLLIFLGWFLVPVAAVMIAGSPLYDNGRQLYFVLPPLFLLAGFALERIFVLLRKPELQAGFLLLIVLPGLYGIIRLHPYEYIYYNQLVGGTGGAYGHYEMDYWGTSYREVALWLDQHAAGSQAWVTGPAALLEPYLQPDVQIACASDASCSLPVSYLVTLARWKEERRCAKADTVFVVGRRGAVFAVVRRLPPGQVCN